MRVKVEPTGDGLTIPERLVKTLNEGCTSCAFDADTVELTEHCPECQKRIASMAYYLFACEGRAIIGPAPVPSYSNPKISLDDPLCG